MFITTVAKVFIISLSLHAVKHETEILNIELRIFRMSQSGSCLRHANSCYVLPLGEELWRKTRILVLIL
jgi:hypothetical protein